MVLLPDEIRNLFFIAEKTFVNMFTKELRDIISDKADQCSQAVVQRQMIIILQVFEIREVCSIKVASLVSQLEG